MQIQPNTLVRLNDYCLVEFFSEQVTLPLSQTFYKLYNNTTYNHQIFNAPGAPTGNSQDRTVTYIGPNQYVYLDQEVSIPYWQRFSNVYTYNSPGTYDTFNAIRFHFTSSFDFTGYAGLILSVKNKMNNGNFVFFSQLLVTAEWYVDMLTNNTSPIYLADVVFDRYIEVYVPAVQLINQDYYSVPVEQRGTEFGGLITNNGISYSGLVQDSPINVSVDECTDIDYTSVGQDTYTVYKASHHYESVISVDAIHQRFGTFIGESSDFDAIEFYGTTVNQNGDLTFADYMITLLTTSTQDDWVIAHQLTVFEWVSGTKIKTGSYMVLQEDNFDAPMYYRPILRNAGNAIAFEIEYTCRLMNRFNGDQIIRVGSYISYSAAKYGKTLSVLPLVAPAKSHVVYNKIVKSSMETTDLFVEQNYVTTGGNITQSIGSTATSTVAYIPMFFNNNSISVSIKDLLPENEDPSTSLIYAQGQLRFILNPFDNLFKFKVYTVNNKGTLVPMDLSNLGTFSMVMFNNNKKMRYAYLIDQGTSNVKTGELMFKIPQVDAELLILSSTREFYITLTASDTTETMIYNGFWNDVTEIDVVNANIAAVTAAQAALTSSSVSTASTTTVSTTVSAAAAVAAANVSAASFTSNTKINIPGYVAASLPENDISVIHIITPSTYTPSADTKQAKAESALGTILGTQSNYTRKTS